MPQQIRVSRSVYTRGSDNLKAAKRYINAGDWDGAAELWERDVNHIKSKVAGRATYNLALISEIEGDLEKAIEWANISYLTHNNKKALVYVNILKDRLEKQKELRKGQGNSNDIFKKGRADHLPHKKDLRNIYDVLKKKTD